MEAKEKLLIKLCQLVDYWDKTPEKYVDGFGGYLYHNQRDRLEGLMHSILASGFDGCGDLPGMEIKPLVPTEDIEFHKNHGQNWFPNDADIGGSLHELMYPIGRKHGFVKK